MKWSYILTCCSHCNVDRVYSLWQSIHPGVEVQPQAAKETTIMYRMGKVQDDKTPLYPFRHPDGTHFTSPDVDKWNSSANFGYRYPEHPAAYFEENNAEGLQKYVRKRAIELFGPVDAKMYPAVPKEAIEKVNKICELASKVPGEYSRIEQHYIFER